MPLNWAYMHQNFKKRQIVDYTLNLRQLSFTYLNLSEQDGRVTLYLNCRLTLVTPVHSFGYTFAVSGQFV